MEANVNCISILPYSCEHGSTEICKREGALRITFIEPASVDGLDKLCNLLI